MSLREVIEEALAHPPLNESTTCDWVIMPIPHELGYKRREIVSRVADSNGQYPDYTLLPETPHTWFLEAKAWTVALQDSHALQALNYANQNGRRWVVLTNGRIWRLYDNDVRGLPADKLVVEVRLDEDAAEEFLRAIGRASVEARGLESAAEQWRLGRFLGEQLHNDNSEIVRAVWEVVRCQPGLERIPRRQVRAALSPETASIAKPECPDATVPDPKTLSAGEWSLDALTRQRSELVTKHKPQALRFPDGTRAETNSWADLARRLVQWLGERSKLPPLPYQAGTGSNYLLNTTPEHKKCKMIRSAEMLFAGQKVYVDMNRSGENFVSALKRLCEAVGEDPSQFRVTLR